MKLCILICVYLVLSFYTSYKKTSCLQGFFKLKNILIQDNAASNSTKLTIAHLVLNFPKTELMEIPPASPDINLSPSLKVMHMKMESNI